MAAQTRGADRLGAGPAGGPPRRVVWIGATSAVVALLLVAAWLYARGGGPVPSWWPLSSAGFDPVAASSPEEAVLRSVRLAGFQRAVAGDSGGTAIVRLEIPEVSSAADAEIAWQAGVASLVEAYPGAGTYVVQLFEGPAALLEARWDGGQARGAVAADDAAALKARAEFVYLPREAAGE